MNDKLPTSEFNLHSRSLSIKGEMKQNYLQHAELWFNRAL
jgi:hypothetical protein